MKTLLFAALVLCAFVMNAQTTNVTLAWSFVNGATNYTVSYGTNVLDLTLSEQSTNNQMTVSNLPPGMWYFEVSYAGANGASYDSAPISFNVPAPPAPPGPPNWTVFNAANSTVTFSWGQSVGITNYILAAASASNVVTASTGATTTGSLQLLPNLLYLTTVTAQSSNGLSSVSATNTFTIFSAPTGLRAVLGN